MKISVKIVKMTYQRIFKYSNSHMNRKLAIHIGVIALESQRPNSEQLYFSSLDSSLYFLIFLFVPMTSPISFKFLPIPSLSPPLSTFLHRILTLLPLTSYSYSLCRLVCFSSSLFLRFGISGLSLPGFPSSTFSLSYSPPFLSSAFWSSSSLSLYSTLHPQSQKCSISTSISPLILISLFRAVSL